ncbi:PspA/IM30 family protein [Pseudomonas aeruginosa]|uniref:PspA/IM30 family protein n=1 Tax=Pseudomonas aeruginosa TaxID=287 RepID=UPI003A4D58E1
MTEEEHDAKLAAEAKVLREEVSALRTKLAMAEDAAAKGDAARQQCGGMEMEIQELRAELAALRARVVVPDGYALVPIEPTVAMRMPWKTMRGHSWYSKYKAMLEAAPHLSGKTVSKGLLREVARHLGNWLELHECECDGGFHYCGRDQVAKTNRELRALLSEQE